MHDYKLLKQVIKDYYLLYKVIYKKSRCKILLLELFCKLNFEQLVNIIIIKFTSIIYFNILKELFIIQTALILNFRIKFKLGIGDW